MAGREVSVIVLGQLAVVQVVGEQLLAALHRSNHHQFLAVLRHTKHHLFLADRCRRNLSLSFAVKSCRTTLILALCSRQHRLLVDGPPV